MAGDEPLSFAEFERLGWEEAAAGYADFVDGLTVQVAGPLLAAAGLGPHGPGEPAAAADVLDIACGPA